MSASERGWDRPAMISVWAPSAGPMTLVRENGAETVLEAEGAGWRAAPGLRKGDRYALRVGGQLVPDPASRLQPGGPGDLSAVTDPDAFAWSDAAWEGRAWHETVLYELHVGSFTPEGTFRAAIQRLPHLVRLGVTTIELMPVGAFDGGWNWGYDGVLPYAPQAGYGGPEGLKALVDACHAHGIAVVLDVVFNHFGPAHNYVADYAPEFFTNKHNTPWGGAINFSQPAVRAFFVENAVYWIEEFHLDGLRLDAVQAVFDDGPTHILAEIAARARAAAPNRRIHLTLENDNNDARWLARDGEDAVHYEAQWNDDFHHVMRVLLAGRTDGYYRDYADAPLTRLGRALTEGFSYQGEQSTHRPGLIRGTPSGHLPPVAFVNFLQNHDQVGNTPFGKRLAALCAPQRLRLGVAVMLLGPAVPMLFMGEEWAADQPFDFFCDYDAPLAEAVRKGRRAEFEHLPEFSDPAQLARLADPNAESTFRACVLDWSALDAPAHAQWFAFYRQLLAVRRDRLIPLLPAIAEGGWHRRVGDAAIEASWAVENGVTLVLAANFSDAPATWAQPAGELLFELGDPDPERLGPWAFRLLLRQIVI